MSLEHTRPARDILNSRLQQLYEDGKPFSTQVSGIPALRIVSFNPPIFEAYGTSSNRAPYVAGTLILRRILTEPHPEAGTNIYFAMQAETDGYGFILDDAEKLNRLAANLGHPDITVHEVLGE